MFKKIKSIFKKLFNKNQIITIPSDFITLDIRPLIQIMSKRLNPIPDYYKKLSEESKNIYIYSLYPLSTSKNMPGFGSYWLSGNDTLDDHKLVLTLKSIMINQDIDINGFINYSICDGEKLVKNIIRGLENWGYFYSFDEVPDITEAKNKLIDTIIKTKTQAEEKKELSKKEYKPYREDVRLKTIEKFLQDHPSYDL